MNSGVLTRRRLVRYITPVVLLSIIYNINRFFEAALKWRDTVPYFATTLLRRENLTYNTCVLGIRCVVLGLLPVTIIVYLNSKIYKDIQDRKNRDIGQLSSSFSNKLGEGVTIGASEKEQQQNASGGSQSKSDEHNRLNLKSPKHNPVSKTVGVRSMLVTDNKSQRSKISDLNEELRRATATDENIPLR